MAEIQIKNVAKRFGDYQALHDINLTIADQEFMVLLGASGCGKSTLLRIIAGLETASEGEVWIGGRRVDNLSPKDRGISMVFQNYAVFPHMTVFENIGFGLRMQKLPDDEVRRRVERTAKRWGLMPWGKALNPCRRRRICKLSERPLSFFVGMVQGNLLEVAFKVVNLLVAPLFVLFFMALFVPWANAVGTIAAAACSWAKSVGRDFCCNRPNPAPTAPLLTSTT